MLETLNKEYHIDNDLCLGLDLGIASCGWALLNLTDDKIIDAGVWGFPIPEVAKTRASKAKVRRGFRGQRRVIRRRASRMKQIRTLFFEQRMLDSQDHHNPKKGECKNAPDPWELRAQGLDRRLSPRGFAITLLHIAKHRAYQSNSKSEQVENKPDEKKKALTAIANNEEMLARYRTVGEMFYKDPLFADRKRNREGDYRCSISRKSLEHEVEKLFKAQRRFGNTDATEALENEFCDIAFTQRPLQGSEKMLGDCPFAEGEKRASSLACSFEKFRYLSRLNTIKIKTGEPGGRRLTVDEIARAIAGFGTGTPEITFKKLKTMIGLPKETEFIGIGEEKEEKDVARRKGAAFGSKTICKAIGKTAWEELAQTPEKLDEIAHILTFLEDMDEIRTRLEKSGLPPDIVDALDQAVRDGAFKGFSKAGHISAKAARAIIPGLLAGKVYSEACEQAGYDHSEQQDYNLDAMTNPVAKRVIRESLKQVNALVRHFGVRPGRIHVELARDVGKGADERKEITDGIDRRTSQKAKNRKAFCELVNKKESECSDTELMRYELWKEQKHRSIYDPNSHIDPPDLLDASRKTEIDHILPRSRSHDNSWHNKVLCTVTENQEKGKKTPWEWFGETDSERWAAFEVSLKALRPKKEKKDGKKKKTGKPIVKKDGIISGYKIRNLLMQDFEENKAKFIERNLNDTRYASRVVMAELKNLYSKEERSEARRLYARPGPLTSVLRRAWWLEPLKYLPGGNKKTRVEDERHHAVDAMVVAGCTERMLQKLIKAYQAQEEKGGDNKVPRIPSPWSGFRKAVVEARDFAFVARSENRRARGPGHKAGIQSVREENGRRIAYQRKSLVSFLKAVGKTRAEKIKSIKTALEKIKDPERNKKGVVKAVESWLDREAPENDPPKIKSKDGYNIIRKITFRVEKNEKTEKTGILVNGGLVDNAAMIRVDVFSKPDKKGKRQFYLVPIYAHKSEDDWPVTDESYKYRFALYPFSYIEIVKSDGEIIEGYYRGTDRGSGNIELSIQQSRQKKVRGIGARNLTSIKKYQIDRLGQKHEIKRETRTWHGVACI